MKKQKIIAKAQKHALKKRYSKAIAEYSKLVQANPKDLQSWLRIADLQLKDGKREESVATYLKVAEQYTKDGFSLKAIAVYRKAVVVEGAPVEINLRIAELFIQHGLRCDAMRHLTAVVEHFEGGPVRLAALRQMVKLEPDDPAHHNLLGDAYLSSGSTPTAIKCYEKAAELLQFAIDIAGPSEDQTDALISVLEKLVQHKEDSQEVVQVLASLYGRPADLVDTMLTDDEMDGGVAKPPPLVDEEDEAALNEALLDEVRELIDALPRQADEAIPLASAAEQARYQPISPDYEAIELEVEGSPGESLEWEPIVAAIRERDIHSMATMIEAEEQEQEQEQAEEIPVEIVPPLSEVGSAEQLIFLDQREASIDSVVIPGPRPDQLVPLDPSLFARVTPPELPPDDELDDLEDDFGEIGEIGEIGDLGDLGGVELVAEPPPRPRALQPEPALLPSVEELVGDAMPGADQLPAPPPDPAPLDLPAVDALALPPEPALGAVSLKELHHQEIPWHHMDTNHDRELPQVIARRDLAGPRIRFDLDGPESVQLLRAALPLSPKATMPGFSEVCSAEETIPNEAGFPSLEDLPCLADLPGPDDLDGIFARIVDDDDHLEPITRVGLPTALHARKQEPGPAEQAQPAPRPPGPVVRVIKRRPRNDGDEGPTAVSKKRQQVLARFIEGSEEGEASEEAEGSEPGPEPTADPRLVLTRKVRQLARLRPSRRRKVRTPPAQQQELSEEMAAAMVQTGLEQVDRFLRRNLLQDAKAILQDLALVSPDNPALEDRWAELYSRELSTMVRALPLVGT